MQKMWEPVFQYKDTYTNLKAEIISEKGIKKKKADNKITVLQIALKINFLKEESTMEWGAYSILGQK